MPPASFSFVLFFLLGDEPDWRVVVGTDRCAQTISPAAYGTLQRQPWLCVYTGQEPMYALRTAVQCKVIVLVRCHVFLQGLGWKRLGPSWRYSQTTARGKLPQSSDGQQHQTRCASCAAPIPGAAGGLRGCRVSACFCAAFYAFAQRSMR